MSNIFSNRPEFPLPAFVKIALAVWVAAVLSLVGGCIALIVWLFTHVHIG